MNKLNKILAIALAVVTLGSAIAIGTLAYLKDKTDSITNTFVVGQNIDIELTETAGTATNYQFKALPGTVIEKDPTVTVKAGSEACYLFVQVDTTIVAGEATWAIADEWTAVDATEHPGLYYINQPAIVSGGTDASYEVLEGNKVTVSASGMAEQRTMTFTAYAIQSEGLTFSEGASTDVQKAAEAWTTLQSELNAST